MTMLGLLINITLWLPIAFGSGTPAEQPIHTEVHADGIYEDYTGVGYVNEVGPDDHNDVRFCLPELVHSENECTDDGGGALARDGSLYWQGQWHHVLWEYRDWAEVQW